ncbi:MAG: response regulator [Kiritimatiellia bacterium]
MCNILLLDDELFIQDLFSQFFREKGYNVVCVSNGRKGLEKLRDFDADLIITDIMMPDMDGLEVVREIRKNYADLPVIAISGGMRNAAINFVSAAKDFGADVIFEKPVELSELLASVKELIG